MAEATAVLLYQKAMHSVLQIKIVQGMKNSLKGSSGNKEADDSAKVKSFFSESNHHGYFTKPNFLTYVGGLDKKELTHLNKLFELTSKSYPINHLLEVETCACCGEQVIKCCFSLPNAQIDLHIRYCFEIEHFLNVYQENLDPTWREFEDLLKEAQVS